MRRIGAPSPSRANSNTDCAGKLAALVVWAPGKAMLGAGSCDSADASAEIADASANAFNGHAGTNNDGV